MTEKNSPSWRMALAKPFVVHRLGDVDVGAEIVAALDLAAVVGGRQHDDGRALEVRIALDLGEDVDAGHVRQVEVEQHQQLAAGADLARAVGAQQIVERAGSVGERHDFVVDARRGGCSSRSGGRGPHRLRP